ncbi:MAG: hypothetical protein EZS28_052693 [Streblomastix strix]|uniref:Uncharacterized protein n=1 Tax=Streblomastix strix TaxID=222440 RepID=A0A5J4RZ39_9EUKA|nr:MAG: hypothetical protein EZS28_052693 [Streblomastix strix]
MSQCANAIKYSSAYDDFSMNGDYNAEDTDKPINITMPYWTAKVESYIEQDQKKNRDSSKNVAIADYEYFKELFEKQRCYICNCKFTWENRPTLDRINNELGHSKDNVLPCCLYCNNEPRSILNHQKGYYWRIEQRIAQIQCSRRNKDQSSRIFGQKGIFN